MNPETEENLAAMAAVMTLRKPKDPLEILKNCSFAYCVAFIANGGEVVRATHLVALTTGSDAKSALAYVRKVMKNPLPICERPHGRDEFSSIEQQPIP